MKIFEGLQRSPEWWELKVGKIGGTRFGQVISTRKNRLVYEIMDEILTGQCYVDEFVSDDMQYGIDNEQEAIEQYEKLSGIEVNRIGAIISDLNQNHIASPDGLSSCGKIVQEIKCTMHGYTHLERYFNGVDQKYLPQCINYFAVSEEIEEVHFVSYCGYRPERPTFWKVLKRGDFAKEIETGRKKVGLIMDEVSAKLDEYQF